MMMFLHCRGDHMMHFCAVSSPMMVGTDIRLMTPIMKELLLNKEAIAINQVT